MSHRSNRTAGLIANIASETCSSISASELATVSGMQIVIPDGLWVRRARYRDGHPQAADVQLAIEVADNSLEKDLEIKRHLYAEVGIIEYWIVDCQNRCVHVFRTPEGTDYREHWIASETESICPLIAPDAHLDLNDLFVGE